MAICPGLADPRGPSVLKHRSQDKVRTVTRIEGRKNPNQEDKE